MSTAMPAHLEPLDVRRAIGRLHLRAPEDVLAGASYSLAPPPGVGEALLGSPSWEVVFGRPGSGKTIHLLHAAREIASNFANDRVASIWVSGRDGQVSMPRTLDPEIEIAARFQQLVHHMVQETLKLPLANPALGASLARGASKRASRDLIETLELVDSAPAPSAVGTASVSRVDSERRGMGRKIRGLISTSEPSSVEASAGRYRAIESAVTSSVEVPAVISARRAGEAFSRAVDALELDRLVIFFDDWDAVLEGMPARAEQTLGILLRGFLLDRHNVSLKIAASRAGSSFDDPRSDGLVLGRDVFQSLDLDLVQPSVAAAGYMRLVVDGGLVLVDQEFATLQLDHGIRPSEVIAPDVRVWGAAAMSCAANPRRLIRLLDRSMQQGLNGSIELSDMLTSVQVDAEERLEALPKSALSEFESIVSFDMPNGIGPIRARFSEEPRTALLAAVLERGLLNPVPRGSNVDAVGPRQYWLDLGAWLALTAPGHELVEQVFPPPVELPVGPWSACEVCAVRFISFPADEQSGRHCVAQTGRELA